MTWKRRAFVAGGVLLCTSFLLSSAMAGEQARAKHEAAKGSHSLQAPRMAQSDAEIKEVVATAPHPAPVLVEGAPKAVIPRLDIAKQEAYQLNVEVNTTRGTRACDDCLTPNADLGDISTIGAVWGGSISGDCSAEGKWYASFTAIAGAAYHFDLCTIGSSASDLDIKITDAACTILAGVDGNSSCGWNPDDFTWTAPANGTYYVVLAPYNSSSSHTCDGTASDTFTMAYYADAGCVGNEPYNDNCEDATTNAVTPGVPLQIVGDNTCATVQGPCFDTSDGETWEAFTLPPNATGYNVTLDFCDTPAGWGNTWLNVALDCPCSAVSAAAEFDTTTCANGNVTMTWTAVPAGTYYFPVMRDAANGAEGAYTLNVLAEEYVPPPCCPVTEDTFPACEDFESGTLGVTTNGALADLVWEPNQGPTGSSGTGPSADHTIGDATGTYLYVETSGTAAGDQAVLETPCYDLTGLSMPRVTFWYHMFGAGMGELKLEVTNDNCLTWTEIWSEYGNQGDQWLLGVIDLTAYAGDTIKLRWTLTVDDANGFAFENDAALDDICVEEGFAFTGACCFDDATCRVLTEADCIGSNGVYNGDLTDCDPNPCSGACCDPVTAECSDTSEAVCANTGGLWQGPATECATAVCPVPGNVCELPLTVELPAAAPMVSANSTCGAQDDYENTCLGSYDGGEDLIYELVVTEDICVDISATAAASSWMGLAIDDVCPLSAGSADCLYKVTSSSGPWELSNVALSTGVYYLMIDTWPSPECVDFELTIETCAIGACCSNGICTEGSEPECAAIGGTYLGDDTTCAGDPCNMGACCVGSACVNTTGMGCSDLGGVYLGGGTMCDSAVCNDDCVNAELVTDGIPAVEGDNTNASDIDDAEASCQANSNHDVWYEYVATCTGPVIASTENSTVSDTVLSVYDGCGTSGVEIVCDDDGGAVPALSAFVTFDAVEGTSYFFRVAGYNTNVGEFDLNILCLTGACCNTNGTCTVVSQTECEADGGVYAGDLTACGDPGDCDANGVVDYCDLLVDPSLDCNDNNVIDSCDIAGATSDDCDANGTPDECDTDCNANGIVDACDVSADAGCVACYGAAAGAIDDCQPDGIPDDCQLGAPAVRAEVLYSQAGIAGDTGVGPSGLLAVGSSCPFNNTSADDFTLDENAQITRIEWQGVYFGSASDFPGADANFHLTIYEDNGAGNVGAVVADFPSVTVTKALAPRPPLLGSNPVYDYAADLPAAVAVDGGQRYWLSVNGDPAGATGPVFGWLASPEGNAADTPALDNPLQADGITCATLPALSMTPGGIDGDADSDLAFAIVGDFVGGADCNSNGIPDDCDIAAGTAVDCDANGVIDDCEFLDCDNNGIHDPCDILQGAADCQPDGIPDKCQTTNNDCDGNGVPDECDLVTDPDCNANGIIDECDVLAGTSEDCQPDFIPDECQLGSGGNPVVVWSEDFEGPAFPPVDWDLFQFGTDTWIRTDNPDFAFSGTNGLYHYWGDPPATEDSYLLTPVITDPGALIEFHHQGCVGEAWCPNYEVDVEIIYDAAPGGASDEFVLALKPLWVNSFEWVETTIDLAPYTPPFRVAFHYYGADGDAGSLDLITLYTPGSGSSTNDCNANGIPDECDNCADLNGDLIVDGVDYQLFRDTYGRADGDPAFNVCADYNDSGAIGLPDFYEWLTCYRDFVGNANAMPPALPGSGSASPKPQLRPGKAADRFSHDRVEDVSHADPTRP